MFAVQDCVFNALTDLEHVLSLVTYYFSFQLLINYLNKLREASILRWEKLGGSTFIVKHRTMARMYSPLHIRVYQPASLPSHRGSYLGGS